MSEVLSKDSEKFFIIQLYLKLQLLDLINAADSRVVISEDKYSDRIFAGHNFNRDT